MLHSVSLTETAFGGTRPELRFDAQVRGTCDYRFRGVQEAFVESFVVHKDVGGTVAVLIEGRPLVDFDKPIAAYWPEFAEKGKAAVTVRKALNHSAGVPAICKPAACRRSIPVGPDYGPFPSFGIDRARKSLSQPEH